MSLSAIDDSCSVNVHLREDIGKCKYCEYILLTFYNDLAEVNT